MVICKKCKKVKELCEFINDKNPDKLTLNCKDCREEVNQDSARRRLDKTSKLPKKSKIPKMSKKLSNKVIHTSHSEDNQDITAITKAARKPLCNQDFGTLLMEQNFMCVGPDKTISPNNYCLNNESGRSIAVINNNDHIEKFAEGGSNKLVNLQLLCPNCHMYKCFLERKNEYGQSMTSEERQSLVYFTKSKTNYN